MRKLEVVRWIMKQGHMLVNLLVTNHEFIMKLVQKPCAQRWEGSEMKNKKLHMNIRKSILTIDNMTEPIRLGPSEHNPPKTDENILIYPIKTIQQIKDESKIRFDEQLKDHALKFSRWLGVNGWLFNYGIGDYYSIPLGQPTQFKTDDELYKQFLNQQP